MTPNQTRQSLASNKDACKTLFSLDCSHFFQAYELSTLTGTQVMLLVASETGHVYTFATRKLQPMITSEAGKTLIQTCLNSPDQPGAGGGSTGGSGADQRMSATGYEETELTYNVPEDISAAEQQQKVSIKSNLLVVLA